MGTGLSSENFVIKVKELIAANRISITVVFFMQVILIKIFFLLLLFGIVLFFLCLHKERTKENARCHKRSAYAAMPAHKARVIII
jgi:hypothetical protein